MATTEILKTTNLQKSFSGIIAAEDINISVKEGEIIGIIGANGAGKTVFVNMITGYLKPTSGSIEFNGKNITGIKPREATHIGVCRSFQVSQVFMSMTVKQNLMIAMSLAKKSGSQLLNPIDDENLWFYFDRKISKGSIINFGDSELLENNVLVINFDKYGIVTQKEFFNKEDMKKIKYSEMKTENPVSQQSFVSSFLQSVRQKMYGKRKF